MTSFKFPPPPPPPSKPTTNYAQQPYATTEGGRGGNDRGRGRGAFTQRSPAFHSSSGGSRGERGQSNGRGHARGRGGSRGGQHNGRGGGNQRRGSNAGYDSHRSPPPETPPIKAYVNPSFINQPHSQNSAQPQVDPNALAQVMSFMSTPAGVQSMAAFASHMTGTGNAVLPNLPVPPSQHTQVVPKYSPPQQAGQKRKMNERDHNGQPHPQQSSTKPPRAKAAVPPPVPSFGFSLPAAPATRAPRITEKGKDDPKKRKLNLGLTQEGPPDESSGEEDVDEEATYAEKLKGGGFMFEHEGEQITIRTGAEVAAWIKDRRKNFPTQKRIVEKAAESATKRQGELEFLRRVHGKPPKAQVEHRRDAPLDTRKVPRKNDRRQEDDKRKQEELAALRKRLHESMVKKQGAPATVDLGLGYDSETESDVESSVLSDSSVLSSSDEASEDDDAGSEPDADDAAPEATSSKVEPPAIIVPPPAPARAPGPPRPASGPAPNSDVKRQVCSNWERDGRCRFSNKCKYAHPAKEDKRMSLYDRLVEQELSRSDELALGAIKYLGQSGFLG